MNTKRKFILLGWDAADWKVINPLMDAGHMPNLEKFVNDGVIGNLATLDPPYSPMLWTSIATGKRPYKHGVHGFSEVTPDGKSVQPVMSTSRKVKAIWEMLSAQNLKSHVVGWWPSHPAEPVNGISISNVFQNHTGHLNEPWPMPPQTVYPESMSEFFKQFRVHPEELTYEHILPFVPNLTKVNQDKDKRLGAVAKITGHASSLHAAFTNIIRTQEWDFAACYLDAIDHYCHGFMKYFPPKRSHIPQADFDLYKDVVTAGYRFHDMMLGRIMDLAGEDATIMLISDHGFQPDILRPNTIPKEPAGPAYEHSPYGIFCLKGPGIKKDELIYGASLLDITPTILSMFGLPVGDDMDGKVLLSAFEKPLQTKSIPSWETIKPLRQTVIKIQEKDDDSQAEMLKQLEDLGYIDKQTGSMESRIKSTADECNFNLAKSYLNGGKIEEAITIINELYQANKSTARYAFRLATCYQQIGELKKCRAIIDELRDSEFYNRPVLNILEGSLLIGEKQPLKALKLFKATEHQVLPEHSKLYYQIATCYTMLKRWNDAERALIKELELDYDHYQAHQMLGNVYLNTKKFQEAADSLLTSVGLEYYNPTGHTSLGRAYYLLGNYQNAVAALEVGLIMNPQNNKARELIVDIYKNQLDQPEKAKEHQEKFVSNIQGTITIVSGLPRSGTSMMMQMLVNGGLQPFTDGKREADENNPKGFYEHEAVKSLKTNKRWVPKAKNKVVKVIANLLPHLPRNYQYKIIFVERDLHQVIASQRKMLNRLGKKTKDEVLPLGLLQSFEKTIENVKQWANQHDNIDIIYVKHQDVLENPFLQALTINEFLDYQLLPELMAKVVDKKLHREKAS